MFICLYIFFCGSSSIFLCDTRDCKKPSIARAEYDLRQLIKAFGSRAASGGKRHFDDEELA